MTNVAPPKRIQRKPTKGWRMPGGAIYVGRPSIFGNPMTRANAIEAGYINPAAPPEMSNQFLVDCFRDWLTGAGRRDDWWQGPESDRRKAEIRNSLLVLRGRDLCCWCLLDQPCHADVLLEIANA